MISPELVLSVALGAALGPSLRFVTVFAVTIAWGVLLAWVAVATAVVKYLRGALGF